MALKIIQFLILRKFQVRISVEEEGKKWQILDDDNDSECEYYENEEGNYVNIWD